MKKIIFLCLIGISLVLNACGEKSTETQNDPTVLETITETNVEQNEDKTKELEGEKIMYPQLSTEVAPNEALVIMNTSMGAIKIKLFPELAPKAVENFLTHAENGYYNGTILHRVIEDFMIQGGDPTGTGMGGESIYGADFEDEFPQNLFNLRGALSMANAGPGTNGSQFFIVQAKAIEPEILTQMSEVGYPEEILTSYDEEGGTPWLDNRHTVFGQVIEGMDIADQIAVVEKDENDKPLEEITIDSIEIVQK